MNQSRPLKEWIRHNAEFPNMHASSHKVSSIDAGHIVHVTEFTSHTSLIWSVRKLPENFHLEKKCENLKPRAITKPIRRGIIPNCGTGRERQDVAHRLRSIRIARGLCPLQGGASAGCGGPEIEGDSGRRQRPRQVRQDGQAGQLQPFQVFQSRTCDAD